MSTIVFQLSTEKKNRKTERKKERNILLKKTALSEKPFVCTLPSLCLTDTKRSVWHATEVKHHRERARCSKAFRNEYILVLADAKKRKKKKKKALSTRVVVIDPLWLEGFLMCFHRQNPKCTRSRYPAHLLGEQGRGRHSKDSRETSCR